MAEYLDPLPFPITREGELIQGGQHYDQRPLAKSDTARLSLTLADSRALNSLPDIRHPSGSCSEGWGGAEAAHKGFRQQSTDLSLVMQDTFGKMRHGNSSQEFRDCIHQQLD
jgi:hypothetical protein